MADTVCCSIHANYSQNVFLLIGLDKDCSMWSYQSMCLSLTTDCLSNTPIINVRFKLFYSRTVIKVFFHSFPSGLIMKTILKCCGVLYRFAHQNSHNVFVITRFRTWRKADLPENMKCDGPYR